MLASRIFGEAALISMMLSGSACRLAGLHDVPQMLLLDSGATLAACQTFHWRAVKDATRYAIKVGSCAGCADIAEKDSGQELSARVALPADGRTIYVRLSAEIAGAWEPADHVYRSPEPSSSALCEAAKETEVGIFHWGGAAARSMSGGVGAVAELGSPAVRLAISPRWHRDYNIDAGCIADFSLANILEDPEMRKALSHPAIRTYMLSTFDGAGFADCSTPTFLSPRFYTAANRSQLVREYADFTFALYRAYANSGKTFFLSNWESDNAVYCGSSYLYATSAEFRTECNRTYPAKFMGNTGPEESFRGMKEWFLARWEGIEKGRRRAAQHNLSGVAVYLAPEISSVRHLEDAGLPSVLYHVLPFVPFDYVSYSAWETINQPDVAKAMKADLDTIRQVSGRDTILLGELGYSQKQWGANTVPRTAEAIEAAAKWGVPYIFYWVLYEDSTASGFGLFDHNGALTPTGSYIRDRALKTNAVPQIH